MERTTDILIVGGGVGGVAAALAACAAGAHAVIVEPCSAVGGQLTTQAVPPDEHSWIETHGSSRRYRGYREAVRTYYRAFYPLRPEFRRDPLLNPGGGWVSPLCHEPRVALAVLDALLRPFVSAGSLVILTRATLLAADCDRDRLRGVTVEHADGRRESITARYFLEASETGDLLALADIEHVTGIESLVETGESSAPDKGDSADMQPATAVFALEHVDGDHRIDRPADYDHWRLARPPGWPGPLLGWTYPNPRTLAPVTPRFRPNASSEAASHEAALRRPDLWSYRRIFARDRFREGFAVSDVTLVNWPMNDYFEGAVFGTADAFSHRARARALGMGLLYWLQTEAPRPDGGEGYPGLRLRPDITGTPDGFAEALYIREGRRLRGITTITEQTLSVSVRGKAGAMRFRDSVGTGAYRIDLHPTIGGRPYLDIAAHPFEIPLGALLPLRLINVIAAGKTIATTHITNGCYRVHPVEWCVGEVAGLLAAHCLAKSVATHEVHARDDRLADFQALLAREGLDLHWRGNERLPE